MDFSVIRAERVAAVVSSFVVLQERCSTARRTAAGLGGVYKPLNLIECARVAPLVVEIGDDRVAVQKFRYWLKNLIDFRGEAPDDLDDVVQPAIDACALLVATYPWIGTGAQ